MGTGTFCVVGHKSICPHWLSATWEELANSNVQLVFLSICCLRQLDIFAKANIMGGTPAPDYKRNQVSFFDYYFYKCNRGQVHFVFCNTKVPVPCGFKKSNACPARARKLALSNVQLAIVTSPSIFRFSEKSPPLLSGETSLTKSNIIRIKSNIILTLDRISF